ncbi:hypothetical protein KEM54_000696 [Ascosphaera aggregata]|nr:hypothetical protein KEM54_000696 [Ascosphaera aggregata]
MAAVVDRGRDRLREHSSWDFAVPIDPIDPEEFSSHPDNPSPYKGNSEAQYSAPLLNQRNERNASPAPRGRKYSVGLGGASRSRSNTQNGKAVVNGSAGRDPPTNRFATGNGRAHVRGHSPKRPGGTSKLSLDTNIEFSDSDYTTGMRNGIRPTKSRTGKSVDTSRMTRKQHEDYWIHRDKLARIESQELQQYGIQLPSVNKRKGAGSRAGSRASSRHRLRTEEFPEFEFDPAEEVQENQHESHREMGNATAAEDEAYLWKDNGLPRENELDAVMPYTAEPGDSGQEGRSAFDYYGTEGDGEDGANHQYPNALTSFGEHTRGISTPTGDYSSVPSSGAGSGPTSPNVNGHRKTSSKIPVSALSRLPIPATPASSATSATSGPNDRPSTSSRTSTDRARSHQNSSNPRVNTAESSTSASASGSSHETSSTSNSPEPPNEANGQTTRKARHSRPLSTGSVSVKVQQQLKQADTNAKSSKDHGGTVTRPTGANARRISQIKTKPNTTRTQQSKDYQKEPTGDPPWLASSFRPDPRLPPEQQILPTHAKRMLQEQWEKEGKSGLLYDKSFAPLAVVDDYMKLQLPPAPENNEHFEDDDKENDNNGAGPVNGNKQNSQPERPVDGVQKLLPDVGLTASAGEETSEPEPPPPAAQHLAKRRSGSSYRTMPPIQRTPSATPSSRGPGSPLAQPPMPQLTAIRPTTSGNIRQQDAEKVAEQSGSKRKEAGCGCCIIM